MPPAITDPDKYLKYLDKEMTIMGVLSVFSVGFAALPLERIVNATEPSFLHQMWLSGRDHLLIGSALSLLAAVVFYLERSWLAGLYGQIALAHVRGNTGEYTVEDWLDEADRRDTWLSYQNGCIMLTVAMLSYGYAVIEARWGIAARVCRWWSMVLPLLVAVSIIAFRWYVQTKFAESWHPFKEWWESISRKKKAP
jgi:hypothetical protein